jgi:hypothetical protein
VANEEAAQFRKAALAALEEIKGLAKEARDIVKEMREAQREAETKDEDD